MRLTSKTDYCLRVLIYLKKNKSRVKIQQIANDYSISKNHLSVVVNTLSELGYITSTPGPHGGIEFNEKFDEHTVGDLVSRVEDFEIAECFDQESNSCTLGAQCKLKGILKKANNAFMSELKKHKIKELV
jgi:Rrf2 family nitric oxide-sensitive transcriptional repressor